MNKYQAKSEERSMYVVPADNTAEKDGVIWHALTILEERMGAQRDLLSSPDNVRNFLRLRLAQLEHEVFVALWLDAQNRLLHYDDLFRGTLTQTAVYPREVVKAALHHNAAGVIFAHNHPSGAPEPSRADEMLTTSLKQALALVDVKVLDHFIIAGVNIMSFAERGLL